MKELNLPGHSKNALKICSRYYKVIQNFAKDRGS